MAKKGFTFDNIPNILGSSVEKAGWSLCIGAGTSAPIFPDWYSLAERLAKEIVPSQTIDMTTMRESGFSPDSLIQMVKNVTNLNDKDFAMRMSQTLYGDFKARIEPDEWSSIAKVLETDFVTHVNPSHWKIFKRYRDSILNETTAFRLAPVILNAIEKDVSPKSILSFNAEPLLLTILNSMLIERYTDKSHTSPKKVFCKIINSISYQGNKQIPYVFCHGLLPVTGKAHNFSTSIDKLVFSEDEYLQIANNAFSWQATTFLSTCATQHVVFIGTSLTDPNMRRWLSWVYSNRINEMAQNGVNPENSTQHYWIRTYPTNISDIPWIEAAVAHLGVRIVWIDNWAQAPNALEKMLGIVPKTVTKTKNKNNKHAKKKVNPSRNKLKKKR